MMDAFGECLRRRRLERGWTVSKLAHLTGISRSSIRRWETVVDYVPPYQYRSAIRLALGLKRDDDHGWWAPDEAATLAVMCPTCGEPGCDGAHLADGRPCPRCDLTMNARATRVWVCTNPECGR